MAADEERMSLDGWDEEETQVFACPVVSTSAPTTTTQRRRAVAPASPARRLVGLLGTLMLFAIVAIGALAAWPRHGELRVRANAANGERLTRASVYLDGKLVCEAVPCRLAEVGPGVHSVRIAAPGYEPSELRAARIERGSQTSVALTLHTQPTATPAASAVPTPHVETIEAQPQPRPALFGKLSLAGGSATSPVAAPDEPRPRPEIDDDAETPPQPEDAQLPGPPEGMAHLQINSIPPSRVALDGRDLGRTPVVDRAVRPGTHTITFEHPRHGRVQRSVVVASGGSASVGHRF